MSFPPTGAPSSHEGDEGFIDLEPRMKDALDNVVDTIMRYGEWPKPRMGSRKQFDLYDWMVEHMDYDLHEFAFAMTLDLDPSQHMLILDAWREKIRGRLMDELSDSAMVLEEAERLTN